MQRRFILLLSLAALIAALLPATAFAWGTGGEDNLTDYYWGTHDWVAWQAYVLADKPEWFDINAAILSTDDPDLDASTYPDHTWNVDDNWGGGPWRVGELYSQAIGQYRAGDYSAASRTFGLLTHYYSDICQPFHTMASANNPYSYLHHPYETAAQVLSHRKTDTTLLAVRPRATATNVRNMTISAATAAHAQLPIVSANFNGKDLSNSLVRSATKIVLSRAVNDLADMLKSIPSGTGQAPAVAKFSKFSAYRHYTGQNSKARADAWVVDSAGRPLRGVKVIITWKLASGTYTHMRFTDANGYACSWRETGSQPYFQQFTATATTVARGVTIKSASAWYVTTPRLKDGSAGFISSMSNRYPARYTSVTARAKAVSTSGKPVKGLRVKFIWKHKTTTVTTYATTDSYGVARSSRNIGGSTAGYRIAVQASTQAGGYNRYWTAYFTPK